MDRRENIIRYRKLNEDEIKIMVERGCVCEDWDRVEVIDGFLPERFKNVSFYGDIRLGCMEKRIDSASGISRKCGIYNSTVFNCVIGDNVYIRNVSNYISNYIIEDDVVIDGINTLEVQGRTCFGNGVRAAVLNEAGGREVPIYDRLSAHEAYIIAMYRHKVELLDKLRSMIKSYSESVCSDKGIIGTGAHISNCGHIFDVNVGPHASIDGIVRLKNGTINSSIAAPAKVGAGVIADDFIMAAGCSVTDGVILEKCFIGQGTELSKQYSAVNSLFFANCGGFHGEACSIFAGPYTVTHHKSTLLIAGLYSFMNAGSGSNQSNHMYKLGPVHQGILERGTKTTSNSYIVFPVRIGAFTLVMGRHNAKSDTSDFPFSYLIEEDDESVLVPGVNIKSIGTIRDSKKWPQRDRRLGKDTLDFITFYLLTPYTVQKMISGKFALEKLRIDAGTSTQKYYHNGVKISRDSLNKGIRYYELGITRFVGNVLVSLLQRNGFSTMKELQKLLLSGDQLGCSRWLDMAGLIVPEAAVNILFKKLESGEISSLEQVGLEFSRMHDNYRAYEIAWTCERLEKVIGKKCIEFSAEDIKSFLDSWINAVEILDEMRCADARKEFSVTAMVGFGIDGNPEDKRLDFSEVRGDEHTNDFITQLKDRLKLKKDTVIELKQKLSTL
jgi:NDP-sugar pyrophosphorylase family protein